MMRIAEALARQNRAQALVTGEVVGQVASQTIENMATIGSVVTLPVLRPLVGMDKEEITAEAQRLGTYPISIIPDQDCCTLFTPKHPATKARAVRSGAGRERRCRSRRSSQQAVRRGDRAVRSGKISCPTPLKRCRSCRPDVRCDRARQA